MSKLLSEMGTLGVALHKIHIQKPLFCGLFLPTASIAVVISRQVTFSYNEARGPEIKFLATSKSGICF